MDANALADGDLNGDGRTDLVLLGDNGSLYFLPQLADHTLGEPQKIPYSGTPKAVQIVDVNGDGRNDLLLVDWDSPTPFRFRLQNAAGQLGPEIYFKIAAHPLVLRGQPGRRRQKLRRDHRAEFRPRGGFAIHPQTGRAFVRRVSPGAIPNPAADQDGRGATRRALGRCQRRRPAGFARGRAGQRADFGLFAAAGRFAGASRRHFPTLAGVSQMAAADWNGDGKSGNFSAEPE